MGKKMLFYYSSIFPNMACTFIFCTFDSVYFTTMSVKMPVSLDFIAFCLHFGYISLERV